MWNAAAKKVAQDVIVLVGGAGSRPASGNYQIIASMRQVCLAALFGITTLFAQTLETRDGNIFLVASTGAKSQLTFENRDLFAVFSPDRRSVAFVRIADPTNDATVEGDRICVLITAGAHEPQCSYAFYQEGERPLGGFVKPTWSPDNRAVYFLADFSTNSEGLCRFDTATIKVAFVSPASEFAILKAGRWSGNILASIETREANGVRYPYFVLSPTGEKLTRAAEGTEKLDAVLARLERMQ
jgi:hypothetical protein